MMILHATIGQNNHNRKKKTAFKNQSMCLRDSVCVCTLRCTRVRSPKVLCTRVLTAASFVS